MSFSQDKTLGKTYCFSYQGKLAFFPSIFSPRPCLYHLVSSCFSFARPTSGQVPKGCIYVLGQGHALKATSPTQTVVANKHGFRMFQRCTWTQWKDKCFTTQPEMQALNSGSISQLHQSPFLDLLHSFSQSAPVKCQTIPSYPCLSSASMQSMTRE